MAGVERKRFDKPDETRQFTDKGRVELVTIGDGVVGHDQDLPEAERMSLDAVDFCRTLAGRAYGTGLLTTIVPF